MGYGLQEDIFEVVEFLKFGHFCTEFLPAFLYLGF